MEINTASAMGEEGIKSEETKLEIGLEDVTNILSSMSLASVSIGNFLVVMRSNFDLTISGEPYTGLVLLLNLRTGKYFSRIWNQTVATGNVVQEDQLIEACEIHFGQGRPCLGRPEEDKNKYVKEEFLISQTPIPRRIATACLKVLGKDVQASVSSCSECSKLSDTDVSGRNNFCEEDEEPISLSKIKNKREVESFTSLKTEDMDEYALGDIGELVAKAEMDNADDYLEVDDYEVKDDVDITRVNENKKYREGRKLMYIGLETVKVGSSG